jgi:hypothetical protein
LCRYSLAGKLDRSLIVAALCNVGQYIEACSDDHESAANYFADMIERIRRERESDNAGIGDECCHTLDGIFSRWRKSITNINTSKELVNVLINASIEVATRSLSARMKILIIQPQFLECATQANTFGELLNVNHHQLEDSFINVELDSSTWIKSLCSLFESVPFLLVFGRAGLLKEILEQDIYSNDEGFVGMMKIASKQLNSMADKKVWPEFLYSLLMRFLDKRGFPYEKNSPSSSSSEDDSEDELAFSSSSMANSQEEDEGSTACKRPQHPLHCQVLTFRVSLTHLKLKYFP